VANLYTSNYTYAMPLSRSFQPATPQIKIVIANYITLKNYLAAICNSTSNQRLQQNSKV